MQMLRTTYKKEINEKQNIIDTLSNKQPFESFHRMNEYDGNQSDVMSENTFKNQKLSISQISNSETERKPKMRSKSALQINAKAALNRCKSMTKSLKSHLSFYMDNFQDP